MTLDDIKSRCEEIGECWIWQRGRGNGYPIIRTDKGIRSVRRVVLELDGRPAAPGQRAITTCGERLCCNPKHAKAVTHSAMMRRAAAAGAWDGMARRAKISKARRKVSKLTPELVQEIRDSQNTHSVIAKQYGLSKGYVQAIRSWKVWREYSNPFSGLMESK